MLPNDGRVVSNFIVQALEGKPLTLYGDGRQTRSFCYVDDLVRGMIALMNHEGATEPVNIGMPEERTVAELAKLVIDLTQSRSAIHYQEIPQDDPVRRCPDISRAKALLGWEPTIGITEGLQRTIDYFKAEGGPVLSP